MSTYRLSSRWACSTLISCLAMATGCSSPAESSSSAAGATSGSASSSGGSSGSSVGGSVSGGSSAGGASGSSNQGGSSGAVAQAGAPGGTNGGGAAGTPAGGTSGSAGAGGSLAGSGGSSGGTSVGGFTLTSPAWTAMPGCTVDNRMTGCPVFPKENIGTMLGGGNKSPALAWTAGPSGTQSYAIVLQDLTNITGGKPLVHWVMWNIPGTTTMLPAGLETTAMPSVPAGSSQRAYSGNGYQGSGKCGNLYEFVLYALPTASFTATGSTQTTVRDGLAATNAPSATLRARSGAPGCTE